MKNNMFRAATFLALLTAIISGTANFLNKIAVTMIKDPIFFTTLKNAVVAAFFIGIILIFKKWREITKLNRTQIVKLLMIGAIGGSIPFVLFFTGLAKTSAISASLIHKTLFLWILLLAIPILKERLTKPQWIATAIIFGANLFVGGFTGFNYNIGELMILGATILWAIENIIAKTALRDISSITVAAARMVIGSVILLAIVAWQGNLGLLQGLNATQWSWTLLTAGLLFGYVLTWYSALKRAPATYVAVLLVPATLVTNMLSALFVTKTLAITTAISSILFLAGIILMVAFGRKTPKSSTLAIEAKASQ